MKLLSQKYPMSFYLLFLWFLVALLGPFLSGNSPLEIVGESRLIPFKSLALPFGTDELGRDLWSRVMYGARLSFFIGFCCVIGSAVIGIFLGALSSFKGGIFDAVIQKITEILLSLPSLLLALVLVAFFGSSLRNTILAVGISFLPSWLRLTRALVLAEKEKSYIEANRSLGYSDSKNLFMALLPNISAPLFCQGALFWGESILASAGLGFLGMGVKPPTAEWGAMIAGALEELFIAPWILVLPGLFLSATVLLFNALGDDVAHFMDPKKK